MSKSESAFKQLYSEFFNHEGDFSKVQSGMKRPIKCLVTETFPYFLVTDGYFFVPAYFTKEAVSEYKGKYQHSIVDLADKVIVLNSWSLEMNRVNSAEVFTSYSNLEARLVVTSFKPMLQDKIPWQRYPVNLFRDGEMKTTVQHFRHRALQVKF